MQIIVNFASSFFMFALYALGSKKVRNLQNRILTNHHLCFKIEARKTNEKKRHK